MSPTTIARFEERYAKLAVAGVVFFVTFEVMYFALSNRPAFWLPSLDGFNNAAFGRDFLNTWMGGCAALADGPAAWFDLIAYNTYLREYFGDEKVHNYFWSYPPHVLLFIWPFGLMPYMPAYILWCVLGTAVLVWACAAVGIERKYWLFIALAPAATLNIFFGQNGTFTAALLLAAFANLDRRPLLAGVCLGVLTLKPQLGILLPIMLLLTGGWRVIVAAVATTMILAGATAWIYGAQIWVDFFNKVVPQQQFLQTAQEGLAMVQIPSAFYAARLLGLSHDACWIAQWIVSALAVAAVIWTFWRRRDPVLSIALLVTATFLASPYTQNYDFVILGPILALLIQRGANELLDHSMIVGVWLMPVAMMAAGLVYIPLAIMMLAAFAARLIWQMAQAPAGVGLAPPPVSATADAERKQHPLAIS